MPTLRHRDNKVARSRPGNLHLPSLPEGKLARRLRRLVSTAPKAPCQHFSTLQPSAVTCQPVQHGAEMLTSEGVSPKRADKWRPQGRSVLKCYCGAASISFGCSLARSWASA